MRIACFGGTFDPPHRGHELLIREVLSSGLADLVLVVPVNVPAHKSNPSYSRPKQRLEMSRLAFDAVPDCRVEGMEVNRGGVSYTFDTVLEMEKLYRVQEKIAVVIGYDLVPGLGSWKHWDELKQRVRFIIARREEDSLDSSSLEGCTWDFLDNPRLDISSRMIRQRCLDGEPISEYVHPKVEQYIQQRGLYGYPKPHNR